MNFSSRWVWHAGGTPAPSRRERGGPPTEIRSRRATDLVPQRAIGRLVAREKTLIESHFWEGMTSSGTQWHDGSRESARDQRRTR